jgi:hypothetical protein
MTDSPQDARHLTHANLDLFWNTGAPLVLPVKGTPECRLQFDPQHGLITLVTGHQVPEPDVAKLKNVTFKTVAHGDKDQAELTVRVEDNVHHAYGFLATIADELQISKSPLAAAVATGVARQKNVLMARGGLTPEKEVGLYGELLFLEYLINTIGDGRAVAVWQGPLSEEHDFVFDSLHVEIKTTVSERRRHTIGSLEQLVPLRGVPLGLISIQLTRTSPDGGRTLPELVAHVRSISGGHVVEVDRRLAGLGWKAEDADLYRTYWTLRTQPRAYHVRGDFPAMTPSLIEPVVPNFARVSDVSYRVDLTDLDHNDIPDPLSGFVETAGSSTA